MSEVDKLINNIYNKKYMWRQIYRTFYTGYNRYTGNKTGQMTEGEIYGYYINNYGSRNRQSFWKRN